MNDLPRLIIISGAGLSAESGIPTFRDAGGLWQKHKIEDVAMSHLVETNKELINQFYNERRAELVDIQPNKAHHIIAELQHEFGSDRVLHFTQNIDDLMEKAGASDTVHVHGNGWEYWCIECNHTWNIGYESVPLDAVCPSCGSSRLRPNIILFGDAAPLYSDMYQALRSTTRKDTILVIGTSGEVLPYQRLVGYSRNKETGLKILITKDASRGGVEGFDLMFFDPATVAMSNLKDLFINRLNGAPI